MEGIFGDATTPVKDFPNHSVGYGVDRDELCISGMLCLSLRNIKRDIKYMRKCGCCSARLFAQVLDSRSQAISCCL